MLTILVWKKVPYFEVWIQWADCKGPDKTAKAHRMILTIAVSMCDKGPFLNVNRVLLKKNIM